MEAIIYSSETPMNFDRATRCHTSQRTILFFPVFPSLMVRTPAEVLYVTHFTPV
jgi:hypothetical protein